MKLIRCNVCLDVRSLHVYPEVRCLCGASTGSYEADGLNAWVAGPCTVIGIANGSFLDAVHNDSRNPPAAADRGHRFEAFIIPDQAPTVRREN